jgi:outer membrane lipopolysaccharide assembly protein LptE/RlpB
MMAQGRKRRADRQRPRRVARYAVILALGVAVGLTGCGYSFRGDRAPVVRVQRMSIPPMTNTTTKVGIETEFTNDFIYEINRNGYAEVVDGDRAEAVLAGVIRDLRTGSVARQSISSTLERRVSVRVDLFLKNRKGKVLWQSSLSDSEAYTVLADKTSTEGNLRRALAIIAQRMAENFHYQFTSSF